MSEIIGLVRDFPFGAFCIILAVLWACERVATAFINRNKPVCDCSCCNEDLDDDVGEEVETEVED